MSVTQSKVAWSTVPASVGSWGSVSAVQPWLPPLLEPPSLPLLLVPPSLPPLLLVPPSLPPLLDPPLLDAPLLDVPLLDVPLLDVPLLLPPPLLLPASPPFPALPPLPLEHAQTASVDTTAIETTTCLRIEWTLLPCESQRPPGCRVRHARVAPPHGGTKRGAIAVEFGGSRRE
jgi:hypothetical protein